MANPDGYIPLEVTSTDILSRMPDGTAEQKRKLAAKIAKPRSTIFGYNFLNKYRTKLLVNMTARLPRRGRLDPTENTSAGAGSDMTSDPSESDEHGQPEADNQMAPDETDITDSHLEGPIKAEPSEESDLDDEAVVEIEKPPVPPAPLIDLTAECDLPEPTARVSGPARTAVSGSTSARASANCLTITRRITSMSEFSNRNRPRPAPAPIPNLLGILVQSRPPSLPPNVQPPYQFNNLQPTIGFNSQPPYSRYPFDGPPPGILPNFIGPPPLGPPPNFIGPPPNFIGPPPNFSLPAPPGINISPPAPVGTAPMHIVSPASSFAGPPPPIYNCPPPNFPLPSSMPPMRPVWQGPSPLMSMNFTSTPRPGFAPCTESAALGHQPEKLSDGDCTSGRLSKTGSNVSNSSEQVNSSCRDDRSRYASRGRHSRSRSPDSYDRGRRRISRSRSRTPSYDDRRGQRRMTSRSGHRSRERDRRENCSLSSRRDKPDRSDRSSIERNQGQLTKSPGKRYRCLVCKKSTDDSQIYRVHMESEAHLGKVNKLYETLAVTSFSCVTCKRDTKNEKSFQRHLASEGHLEKERIKKTKAEPKLKTFTCSVCKMPTPDELTHLCQMKSLSRLETETIDRDESKPKSYFCPECDLFTKNKELFSRHMKSSAHKMQIEKHVPKAGSTTPLPVQCTGNHEKFSDRHLSTKRHKDQENPPVDEEPNPISPLPITSKHSKLAKRVSDDGSQVKKSSRERSTKSSDVEDPKFYCRGCKHHYRGGNKIHLASKLHRDSVSSMPPYYCERCGICCKTADMYDDHMLNKHRIISKRRDSSRDLKLGEIGDLTPTNLPTSTKLDPPPDDVSSILSYYCAECGIHYENAQAYDRHIARRHRSDSDNRNVNPISNRDANPSSSKDASPSCSKDASPSCSKDASPSCSKDASPSCSKDVSPSCSKDVSPSCSKDASLSCNKDANPSCNKDANRSSNKDTNRSSNKDTNRSSNKDINRSRNKDANPISNKDANRSSNKTANPSGSKDANPISNKDANRSSTNDANPSRNPIASEIALCDTRYELAQALDLPHLGDIKQEKDLEDKTIDSTSVEPVKETVAVKTIFHCSLCKTDYLSAQVYDSHRADRHGWVSGSCERSSRDVDQEAGGGDRKRDESSRDVKRERSSDTKSTNRGRSQEIGTSKSTSYCIKCAVQFEHAKQYEYHMSKRHLRDSKNRDCVKADGRSKHVSSDRKSVQSGQKRDDRKDTRTSRRESNDRKSRRESDDRKSRRESNDRRRSRHELDSRRHRRLETDDKSKSKNKVVTAALSSDFLILDAVTSDEDTIYDPSQPTLDNSDDDRIIDYGHIHDIPIGGEMKKKNAADIQQAPKSEKLTANECAESGAIRNVIENMMCVEDNVVNILENVCIVKDDDNDDMELSADKRDVAGSVGNVIENMMCVEDNVVNILENVCIVKDNDNDDMELSADKRDVAGSVGNVIEDKMCFEDDDVNIIEIVPVGMDDDDDDMALQEDLFLSDNELGLSDIDDVGSSTPDDLIQLAKESSATADAAACEVDGSSWLLSSESNNNLSTTVPATVQTEPLTVAGPSCALAVTTFGTSTHCVISPRSVVTPAPLAVKPTPSVITSTPVIVSSSTITSPTLVDASAETLIVAADHLSINVHSIEPIPCDVPVKALVFTAEKLPSETPPLIITQTGANSKLLGIGPESIDVTTEACVSNVTSINSQAPLIPIIPMPATIDTRSIDLSAPTPKPIIITPKPTAREPPISKTPLIQVIPAPIQIAPKELQVANKQIALQPLPISGLTQVTSKPKFNVNAPSKKKKKNKKKKKKNIKNSGNTAQNDLATTSVRIEQVLCPPISLAHLQKLGQDEPPKTIDDCSLQELASSKASGKSLNAGIGTSGFQENIWDGAEWDGIKTVFSKEDLIMIAFLRGTRNYDIRRLRLQFPGRNWPRHWLVKLLDVIDKRTQAAEPQSTATSVKGIPVSAAMTKPSTVMDGYSSSVSSSGHNRMTTNVPKLISSLALPNPVPTTDGPTPPAPTNTPKPGTAETGPNPTTSKAVMTRTGPAPISNRDVPPIVPPPIASSSRTKEQTLIEKERAEWDCIKKIFSEEDVIIITFLREKRKFSAIRIRLEFPKKKWPIYWLTKLIDRIDRRIQAAAVAPDASVVHHRTPLYHFVLADSPSRASPISSKPPSSGECIAPLLLTSNVSKVGDLVTLPHENMTSKPDVLVSNINQDEASVKPDVMPGGSGNGASKPDVTLPVVRDKPANVSAQQVAVSHNSSLRVCDQRFHKIPLPLTEGIDVELVGGFDDMGALMQPFAAQAKSIEHFPTKRKHELQSPVSSDIHEAKMGKKDFHAIIPFSSFHLPYYIRSGADVQSETSADPLSPDKFCFVLPTGVSKSLSSPDVIQTPADTARKVSTQHKPTTANTSKLSTSANPVVTSKAVVSTKSNIAAPDVAGEKVSVTGLITTKQAICVEKLGLAKSVNPPIAVNEQAIITSQSKMTLSGMVGKKAIEAIKPSFTSPHTAKQAIVATKPVNASCVFAGKPATTINKQGDAIIKPSATPSVVAVDQVVLSMKANVANFVAVNMEAIDAIKLNIATVDSGVTPVSAARAVINTTDQVACVTPFGTSVATPSVVGARKQVGTGKPVVSPLVTDMTAMDTTKKVVSTSKAGMAPDVAAKQPVIVSKQVVATAKVNATPTVIPSAGSVKQGDATGKPAVAPSVVTGKPVGDTIKQSAIVDSGVTPVFAARAVINTTDQVACVTPFGTSVATPSVAGAAKQVGTGKPVVSPLVVTGMRAMDTAKQVVSTSKAGIAPDVAAKQPVIVSKQVVATAKVGATLTVIPSAGSVKQCDATGKPAVAPSVVTGKPVGGTIKQSVITVKPGVSSATSIAVTKHTKQAMNLVAAAKPDISANPPMAAKSTDVSTKPDKTPSVTANTVAQPNKPDTVEANLRKVEPVRSTIKQIGAAVQQADQSAALTASNVSTRQLPVETAKEAATKKSNPIPPARSFPISDQAHNEANPGARGAQAVSASVKDRIQDRPQSLAGRDGVDLSKPTPDETLKIGSQFCARESSCSNVGGSGSSKNTCKSPESLGSQSQSAPFGGGLRGRKRAGDSIVTIGGKRTRVDKDQVVVIEPELIVSSKDDDLHVDECSRTDIVPAVVESGFTESSRTKLSQNPRGKRTRRGRGGRARRDEEFLSPPVDDEGDNEERESCSSESLSPMKGARGSRGARAAGRGKSPGKRSVAGTELAVCRRSQRVRTTRSDFF